MPNDLGTRVAHAGLATREQVARALALVSQGGGSLVPALVAAGVPEEGLVGYLLAEGFGPLQDAEALASARPEAASRLSAEAAHGWVALPLGWTPAGLVVAMADPSDPHAVAELERLVGGPILPTVARLSDLREALRDRYGDPPASHPPRAVRTPASTATRPGSARPSTRPRDTRETHPGPAAAPPQRGATRTFPRLAPREGDAEADHAPIPLRARVGPRRPPSEQTAPGVRSRRQTAEQVRRNSIPSYDRWEFASSRRSSLPPGTRRRASTRSDRPGLVSLLAQLAQCDGRDEAITLACEAAARLGRSALFLASHRGVLKGRHGVGRDVSLEAVRNLWIPLSSDSLLASAARAAERYQGPHGEAPADRLLRSALGAEKAVGSLWLEPVCIGRSTVGLLCVEAPLQAPETADDMAAVAEALADALTRALHKLR